jgi:hypothetical protein
MENPSTINPLDKRFLIFVLRLTDNESSNYRNLSVVIQGIGRRKK